MKKYIFLSGILIILSHSSAKAFERKPLSEALYICAFEVNKALLSGPGRQNEPPLNNTMLWCMQKEGYAFVDNKADENLLAKQCSRQYWQHVTYKNCYEKNDL